MSSTHPASTARNLRTGTAAVRRLVPLVGLALVFSFGCSDIYTLPDAPPRESWVDLDAPDEEDEQEKLRRFLDAKRTAITVYSAMQKGDWDTVVDNMSQETRAFLEDGSGGAGAKVALESGELDIAGQQITFDPATDFFIDDLQQIEDTLAGQVENETKRRKELFVINKSGEARKVLFIYEGDKWVFHSPFLRTPKIAVPQS